MKKFNVNPDLLFYLENVLKRADVEYKVNDDSTVSARVSGELFHKFIIRARCEKRDYEEEGDVVTVAHVHVSELRNPHVMKRIDNSAYIIVGRKNNKI